MSARHERLVRKDTRVLGIPVWTKTPERGDSIRISRGSNYGGDSPVRLHRHPLAFSQYEVRAEVRPDRESVRLFDTSTQGFPPAHIAVFRKEEINKKENRKRVTQRLLGGIISKRYRYR